MKKTYTQLVLGLAIITGAYPALAATVTMEQLIRAWGLTPLAYEPFDYQAGVGLDGNCNGGYGFSEAWAPNLPSGGSLNNQLITAGSLYYTDAYGNTVMGIGNKVHITGDGTAAGDNTGGFRANAQPRRALSFQRGNENDSTWVAFLSVRTGLPKLFVTNDIEIYYGRATSVQLFQGANSERLTIGRASQNNEPLTILPKDTWALVNRGSAAYTSPTTVPLTNVPPNSTANLIIVRIDHQAGDDRANAPDTAYIWINPENILDLPTENALAVSFAGNGERDYWFDTIRLFAGNFRDDVGYGSADIDEIIIAVPEPTTLALFAICAAAALHGQRKRSQLP